MHKSERNFFPNPTLHRSRLSLPVRRHVIELKKLFPVFNIYFIKCNRGWVAWDYAGTVSRNNKLV